MNVLVTPKQAKPVRAPRSKRRPRRDDQAFLAPDLEILETPPSPVGLALLLIICGFAVGGVTWAHFGRVDIIATAQGKLEPLGKVNVIQPLETGRVASILRRNGNVVHAGDVLVRLDGAELAIQYESLSQQRNGLNAEIVRRAAAVAAIPSDTEAVAIAVPSIDWENVPPELARREESVLRSELEALRSGLMSVEAQIDAKVANTQSAENTIAVQRGLLVTMNELVSMRESLAESQSGSRADWLTAVQAVRMQEVALANQQGALSSETGAIAVLEAEAVRLRGEFLAENARQSASLQKQRDEIEHQLDQLSARLARLELRSPIDGTIQASTITSIGQVVTTGEEVMRVVPDGPLVIEAYLPNQDVGFVRVGQEATIKVSAFPFTQYGTIEGTIIAIGSDALTAQEAQSLLATDSRTGPTSPTGGALAALVFPITVEIDDGSLMNDGRLFELSAGMSVIVEVDTGSRSILEYLFSPLVELGSTAMSER